MLRTGLLRLSEAMRVTRARRMVAETFGTALLLAAVVGSGIMGERLSGGNLAIALLANALATGAMLVALILMFGPISGAHFNPVVTLADAWLGGVSWKEAPGYMMVQPILNTRFLIAVLLALTALASLMGAQSASASKEDEDAIRAIVKASAAGTPDRHVAADLDWENAFGIRYNDLKKRDDFYKSAVAPLQKDAADSTLEVKVKFVEATVAVADEYWRIIGQIDEDTHKPGADRWGRTTYIFKKQDGAWTEVMERVADLRLPYFKHYDEMPKPFALSPEILASYAGSYEAARGHQVAAMTVSGDRLQVTLRGRQRTAIPISATEFLVFDSNDLAQYLKIQFAKEADGNVSMALSYPTGETITKAMKAE